jgi:hypothetical protein
MKRLLRPLYVLIALAMAHVPVVAQDEQPHIPPVAPWSPDTGYWVAESNANQPKQCTLYFYTDDHVLVYKEKIEGLRLNLNSRRVKMRLKKVLEKSLWAWQKHHRAKENEGLVISLLQGK